MLEDNGKASWNRWAEAIEERLRALELKWAFVCGVCKVLLIGVPIITAILVFLIKYILPKM